MSDGLGLDDGSKDVITLHNGVTLETHGPAMCFGPNCCIHNPSDHPLKEAPLTWVPQMRMMFRVCEHEHIHPDPDAMDFHLMLSLTRQVAFYDGYHPCCEGGCCGNRPPGPRVGTFSVD